MARFERSDDAASALPAEPAARTAGYYALRMLPPFALAALAFGILAYVEHEALPSLLRPAAAALASAEFWQAAAVGLFAQLIDGALGMAYGVTSTSFLLSIGVPPATASASVHIAEVFTTGFSGFSHWKLGNVNKSLFKRLVIPGVIGGVAGAYLLTAIDGDVLAPWISGYLLVMGLYILVKVFRRIVIATEPPTYVAPLALTGGFVDAIGGGGWGPVVTTSLLGGGQEPRRTIGSVNAAEFFIAISTGFSLAMLGGITAWTTIVGLVAGGVCGAPLASVLVRYAPPKLMMAFVGLLIVTLSVYNLSRAFG
jgi:uncharacterized membrane protein YfcA